MAAVKRPETSGSQQLLLVLFFAFLLLPMAGSKFVAGQLAKEQREVLSVFGAQKGGAILDRSEAWFRRGFVRTGMVGNSLKEPEPTLASVATPTVAARPAFAKPAAQPINPSRVPITPKGDNAVKKISRHWIGGAWAILYMMFTRLSALLTVVPLLVPFAVAVLCEGAARRKMKWYAFGGSEPRLYVVGLRLGVWCGVISLLALVSPGALPVLAVPVLMLMSVIGFALWTANQQKPM